MNNARENWTDQDRYQFLIRKIAETKQAWLLQANPGMSAMFEDNNGQEYLPVWPDEESAVRYSEDDWNDYQPEPVSLSELAEWCKELETDLILIAAYPDHKSNAVPLKPLQFISHIRAEMELLNKPT
jgi:hypothetical protein